MRIYLSPRHFPNLNIVLLLTRSSFYRFEVQLVLLLFIFLIFPELIRGAYFATNFKLVLGVTEYSFKKFPQTCLKVCVLSIIFPR